jgi:hypothetical protein
MRDDRCIDRNGFTAAIILRTLRRVPGTGTLQALRRRALDFLEGCASHVAPGGFAFWPDHLRPAWGQAVPADVDDTAIIACELHRHGRLDRSEALRALCTAILPCRVRLRSSELCPGWIADGSFHTWMAPDSSRVSHQIVDCCVNANIAALMARLGARHLPGYCDAVRTVEQGLAWAGGDRARLDSLTPFYPSPHALLDAVEHAVECGAHALRGALDLLAAFTSTAAGEDAGCCRSAYGNAVWHCAAIDAARRLARDGIAG